LRADVLLEKGDELRLLGDRAVLDLSRGRGRSGRRRRRGSASRGGGWLGTRKEGTHFVCEKIPTELCNRGPGRVEAGGEVRWRVAHPTGVRS